MNNRSLNFRKLEHYPGITCSVGKREILSSFFDIRKIQESESSIIKSIVDVIYIEDERKEEKVYKV